MKVDVTVFNYMPRKKPVNADIRMINDEGEFEFVDAKTVGSECKITEKEDDYQTKTITVPSNGGASTFFLIRATRTGEIKIKVRASTSSISDEVERKMIVEHEGLI